jgi:hypothetical protein
MYSRNHHIDKYANTLIGNSGVGLFLKEPLHRSGLQTKSSDAAPPHRPDAGTWKLLNESLVLISENTPPLVCVSTITSEV